MSIITLTTDFGLKDHYSAILKGHLLDKNPNLNIVDITHNIKKYDIVQASYLLKNSFYCFPKGSIHIASVNNYPDNRKCFLAIRKEGHYFIGPDNGLFSLMFDDLREDMYELEYNVRPEFPLSTLYSNAVGHIASGRPFNEIGIPVVSIEQRLSLQAVTTENQIRGSVIHVDDYENVIVNITRDKFNEIGKSRTFSIYFKRNNPIKNLVSNYADVPIGEMLCHFNSADHLEIAINMGKASTLLGLKKDDGIEVEFHD